MSIAELTSGSHWKGGRVHENHANRLKLREAVYTGLSCFHGFMVFIGFSLVFDKAMKTMKRTGCAQ